MIEIIPTEGIAIMFRQHRKAFGVACCLFSICVTLAWNATCPGATIIGPAVLLSTLLTPGGTITAGDKEFTNFNYNFTGDMPTAAGVNVIPIQDDFGNFGIRFQAAFIDFVGAPGGSDALITYVVTATKPGFLISDAHLQGNPTALGPLGSMSVTETFLPLGAGGEFTMTIYDDSNLGTKLTDFTVFTTPQKSLQVQKDILGLARTNPNQPTANTVTLSFVDQTFSQIPEPAAGLLMLIGAVGLGFARRRHTLKR